MRVRLRTLIRRRSSATQGERPLCPSVPLQVRARSANRRSAVVWAVAAMGTAACAVVASTAVAGATTSTTSLIAAGQSGARTVRTHPAAFLDNASFGRRQQALAFGSVRPLRTGFLDPSAFGGPNANRSVLRARRAGATLVRLMLAWKAVAPVAPADPEDPEDPAYQWQSIDQQVADAVRGGLDPLIYVSASAPWAHGAAVGLPGTWPSPARFADFAQATARRYSGTFIPTGATAALPRVRLWQVWNEPNAGRELAPQRVKGRSVSPAQYRRMVNAFADAVHGVSASNLVVAGGLGPFGHDSKDIQVVAPMRFMSILLCVSLKAPHRKTCSQRTHFDVWSHHPYSNGGPTWHAHSPNDASIGDLPEMRALLTAAERAGTITSARAPKFWVTEFSWDTRPPDPQRRAVRTARALGCRGPLPHVAGRSQRGHLVSAAGRPSPPVAVPIRLLHRGRTGQAFTRGVPIPFRGTPCRKRHNGLGPDASWRGRLRGRRATVGQALDFDRANARGSQRDLLAVAARLRPRRRCGHGSSPPRRRPFRSR